MPARCRSSRAEEVLGGSRQLLATEEPFSGLGRVKRVEPLRRHGAATSEQLAAVVASAPAAFAWGPESQAAEQQSPH